MHLGKCCSNHDIDFANNIALSFLIQNLQNALDKLYDAKVPDVWLKVLYYNFIVSMLVISLFFVCIRCPGSPRPLGSGTQSY